MEEVQYDNGQFLNPKPQRPTVLSVICILSFISGVWNALYNFCLFGMHDTFNKMLADDEMMEKLSGMMDGAQYEAVQSVYHTMFSIDKVYYLLTSLLYVGSFVGAVFMWKMRKTGFHVYAIAQILILIAAALFFYGPTGASPWMDVIMTAIFITWYYTFYKKEMQ